MRSVKYEILQVTFDILKNKNIAEVSSYLSSDYQQFRTVDIDSRPFLSHINFQAVNFQY